MAVYLALDTGDQVRLDRSLRIDQVAERINAARGSGELIEFQNDATPSRAVWIDPDHVVSIKNDYYNY
jgi:hypothetical protein